MDLKMNGKSLSMYMDGAMLNSIRNFSNGGTVSPAFSEVVTPELFMDSRFEPFYASPSNGTATYYKGWGFLYTDGVKEFADSMEAYWTLDVVASYMRLSRTFIHTDSNGKAVYTVNDNGVDDFMVILFYVYNGKCYFSIESEATGKKKTIAFQYIPYTDLNCSVKFYLNSGVLMMPEEY